MLNVFPDLLTWSFFAPFLLRVALGFLFFDLGRYALTKGKIPDGAFFETLGLKPGTRYATMLGVVEIAVAILLIVGLYTQIAALAALILSLKVCYFKGVHREHRRNLFFLTAIISLSLLLTGGGAIAFDLPL